MSCALPQVCFVARHPAMHCAAGTTHSFIAASAGSLCLRGSQTAVQGAYVLVTDRRVAVPSVTWSNNRPGAVVKLMTYKHWFLWIPSHVVGIIRTGQGLVGSMSGT